MPVIIDEITAELPPASGANAQGAQQNATSGARRPASPEAEMRRLRERAEHLLERAARVRAD